MEGSRSRRAIKTPKRFDDEAFDTPSKQHQPPKQTNSSQESIKVTPEPAPIKSIIKVKLATKSRVSIGLPKPKDSPTKQAKESVKPKEAHVKPSEPAKQQICELVQPKLEPTQADVDQELEGLQVNVEPSSSPQVSPAKVREYNKLKDLTTKSKDHVRKESITPKPKETLKPKEHKPRETVKPKEVVLSEKDFPPTIVSRPKTKRPRTPPVYEDVIPNVVLPFWDARTAADEHEDDNVKELVHCNCGIDEELGLMIQCETCLTWQHAHCLGIENPEDVPDGYTCKACSDPRFARESRRYAYNQEWLTKGKMRKFACDPVPMPEERVSSLKKINQFIADSLQLHKLIHSLQVKKRILENASDDDPELRLFRVKWASNTSGVVSSSNNEAGPEDCRENLREHIKEIEDYVARQVSNIEKELEELEKGAQQETGFDCPLDSIRHDLETMRHYVSLASQQHRHKSVRNPSVYNK